MNEAANQLRRQMQAENPRLHIVTYDRAMLWQPDCAENTLDIFRLHTQVRSGHLSNPGRL